MSNELTAFLNFVFEKKQAMTKVVEDDEISKALRWQLNWREYEAHLRSLGIKADSEERPSLLRYGNPQPDIKVLDDLMDFQATLRKIITNIVIEKKIPPAHYLRFFSEANGVSTFLPLPDTLTSDITPGNIGSLGLHYSYDASTYRIFMSAVIRDMIVDKTIFNLRIDNEGKFYLTSPIKESDRPISSMPYEYSKTDPVATGPDHPSIQSHTKPQPEINGYMADPALQQPGNGTFQTQTSQLFVPDGSALVDQGKSGENSLGIPEHLLSLLTEAISERLARANMLPSPSKPPLFSSKEANLQSSGYELGTRRGENYRQAVDQNEYSAIENNLTESNFSEENPASSGQNENNGVYNATFGRYSNMVNCINDDGDQDFICFPDIDGDESQADSLELKDSGQSSSFFGYPGDTVEDVQNPGFQASEVSKSESVVQGILDEMAIISSATVSDFNARIKLITSLMSVSELPDTESNMVLAENGSDASDQVTTKGEADEHSDMNCFEKKNTALNNKQEDKIDHNDYIIEEVIEKQNAGDFEDDEPLLLEEVIYEEIEEEENGYPFVHDDQARDILVDNNNEYISKSDNFVIFKDNIDQTALNQHGIFPETVQEVLEPMTAQPHQSETHQAVLPMEEVCEQELSPLLQEDTIQAVASYVEDNPSDDGNAILDLNTTLDHTADVISALADESIPHQAELPIDGAFEQERTPLFQEDTIQAAGSYVEDNPTDDGNDILDLNIAVSSYVEDNPTDDGNDILDLNIAVGSYVEDNPSDDGNAIYDLNTTPDHTADIISTLADESIPHQVELPIDEGCEQELSPLFQEQPIQAVGSYVEDNPIDDGNAIYDLNTTSDHTSVVISTIADESIAHQAELPIDEACEQEGTLLFQEDTIQAAGSYIEDNHTDDGIKESGFEPSVGSLTPIENLDDGLIWAEVMQGTESVEQSQGVEMLDTVNTVTDQAHKANKAHTATEAMETVVSSLEAMVALDVKRFTGTKDGPQSYYARKYKNFDVSYIGLNGIRPAAEESGESDGQGPVEAIGNGESQEEPGFKVEGAQKASPVEGCLEYVVTAEAENQDGEGKVTSYWFTNEDVQPQVVYIDDTLDPAVVDTLEVAAMVDLNLEDGGGVLTAEPWRSDLDNGLATVNPTTEAENVTDQPETGEPIVLLNAIVGEEELAGGIYGDIVELNETVGDELVDESSGEILELSEMVVDESVWTEAVDQSTIREDDAAELEETDYDGVEYEEEAPPIPVMPEPWPDGFKGSDGQPVEYLLSTMEARIYKKQKSRTFLVPTDNSLNWEALQKRRLKGM
jgi:hypothetical protein